MQVDCITYTRSLDDLVSLYNDGLKGIYDTLAPIPGADPGFFLGGGALVSRSTSTPIKHIVFFVAEYQLY